MLVAKCVFANLWTLLYEVYLQTLCSGINYIFQEEQAIVLPELPFKILSRENFYDGHLLPFFVKLEITRWKYRSSRPEVFCKKGVIRNFAKFPGKHLCQRLFFNKVAGLWPVTLLSKKLWHGCFPVNFVKLLRTPFSIGHLWWLLLKVFLKSKVSFRKRFNSVFLKHAL